MIDVYRRLTSQHQYLGLTAAPISIQLPLYAVHCAMLPRELLQKSVIDSRAIPAPISGLDFFHFLPTHICDIQLDHRSCTSPSICQSRAWYSQGRRAYSTLGRDQPHHGARPNLWHPTTRSISLGEQALSNVAHVQCTIAGSEIRSYLHTEPRFPACVHTEVELLALLEQIANSPPPETSSVCWRYDIS